MSENTEHNAESGTWAPPASSSPTPEIATEIEPAPGIDDAQLPPLSKATPSTCEPAPGIDDAQLPPLTKATPSTSEPPRGIDDAQSPDAVQIPSDPAANPGEGSTSVTGSSGPSSLPGASSAGSPD